MKKLIILLIIGAWPCVVNASPYFKLIDPSHPQPVVGAMVDPLDLNKTSAGTLLPLITHSPAQGCILPNIICEDWTPLAIGASMASGKLTFDVAPLANVLPWFQAAAVAITPTKWTPLLKILSSPQDQSVTFSAGPVWEYQQLTNHGYFKIFTGLALHF